jgi:hypothetical protein
MIGIIKQRCLPMENLQNLGKKHTNVFIIRFKCAALPNKNNSDICNSYRKGHRSDTRRIRDQVALIFRIKRKQLRNTRFPVFCCPAPHISSYLMVL